MHVRLRTPVKGSMHARNHLIFRMTSMFTRDVPLPAAMAARAHITGSCGVIVSCVVVLLALCAITEIEFVLSVDVSQSCMHWFTRHSELLRRCKMRGSAVVEALCTNYRSEHATYMATGPRRQHTSTDQRLCQLQYSYEASSLKPR